MEKEKNLTQPKEKKSLFFKFIHGIEVVGNKLPQPFYLFSILIVVAISSPSSLLAQRPPMRRHPPPAVRWRWWRSPSRTC